MQIPNGVIYAVWNKHLRNFFSNGSSVVPGRGQPCNVSAVPGTEYYDCLARLVNKQSILLRIAIAVNCSKSCEGVLLVYSVSFLLVYIPQSIRRLSAFIRQHIFVRRRNLPVRTTSTTSSKYVLS